MERQIEEVRLSAASARRLGLWTLGIGLSSLAAALAIAFMTVV
jgi:hypothetical protein